MLLGHRSLHEVELHHHRHNLYEEKFQIEREEENDRTFLTDFIINIILTFPLSFRCTSDCHLTIDDFILVFIRTEWIDLEQR